MTTARITGYAALVFVLVCTAVQGACQGMGGATAHLASISVAFKLDPRLSGGSYGGEVWVSPATFTGAAGQDTIEAKAAGVGSQGQQVRVIPIWTAADSAMVTVSPGEGEQVKILVKRAGESVVRVTADSVASQLSVKAEYKSGVILVQITQAATVAASAGNDFSPARNDEQGKLAGKETTSYALGMNFVNVLRKQSVDVDLEELIAGLKAAYSGSQMRLTEQDARSSLLRLQQELKAKNAALRTAKLRQAADENQKEGKAFLAANALKDGVVTLPSGLQFKVLKAGTGPRPAANDIVVCHYRGSFTNGKEFDSTYKRKRPATFAVTKVIKGWSEALQLMPAGSEWQIFIPPQLAYGERGMGKQIEPNSTLIFDVELISVNPSSPPQTQRASVEVAK